MKEHVKVWCINYLPFIIITALMLIMHFNCTPRGDEIIQAQEVAQMGYWNVISNMLKNLTSTGCITLMATYLFSGVLPKTAWALFDTTMVLIIALSFSYIIRKLTGFKNIKALNWIITLLILGYPIYDFPSGGWIAATIGYVFPLAFTALAFVPIAKIYDGKKIPVWEYAIYFIAANIASNAMQFALYIIGIYGLFILERIICKKKPNIFFIIQFFTGITWAAAIFFSPGVKMRKIIEIRWWHDFDMFTPIQKLKLSVATSLNQLVRTPNLTFILLCVGLAVLVFIMYRCAFYRTISVIPVFFATMYFLINLGFFELFSWLKEKYFFWPGESYLESALPKQVIPNSAASFTAYLPLILQLFAFLLILLCIYLVFKNTKTTILLVAILLIGFVSRISMAASPTLYASDTRTFVAMYAGMMFVAASVWSEYFKVSKSIRKKIFQNPSSTLYKTQ